ncbi:MAG: Dam family site-specific DNA-(adenine-N6)-methyltransferase, partial [Tetragenococcus halophilus]|nr:Dam family site-specific DNA-(adenine-N6)-methyltransferase [Tetragenococcus halophilus]
GVVGFPLAPERAVFSDPTPYIIDFYNSIKDGSINSTIVREFLEKESVKLAATPEDKNSYYYEVRERFNKTHSPLDFLFLQRSNFNGMIRFNSKGGYNVPFCRKPNRFAPALITKIVNQVKHVEYLIQSNEDWSFKVMKFEEIFDKVAENDFIYLDPPYIDRHDQYFESWNQEKADQLATLTQNSPAEYALSMWYKNKYRENEYLKQWDSGILRTTEHFYHVGGKAANRNAMVEALIISENTVNNDLFTPPLQTRQLTLNIN